MYQQITIIGNVGSDPEMRYTPSGVAVTSFTIAVNKKWTGQDGSPQDKTTWFRVTAWRKLAELTSQYLTKGRQVMVIGEIEEARPYTRKDGELAASLEVTAQTIKFLGSRGDQGAQSVSDNGTQPAQPESVEEIPF